MSEGLPPGALSFASWFWAKQPESSEKVQISKRKQCVINTVIILTLLAQQQKILQQPAGEWGWKKPSNVERWSPTETMLVVAGSSQSKAGFAGRVNINVIEKVRQVFQKVLCAQGLTLFPDYIGWSNKRYYFSLQILSPLYFQSIAFPKSLPQQQRR